MRVGGDKSLYCGHRRAAEEYKIPQKGGARKWPLWSLARAGVLEWLWSLGIGEG